MVTDGQVRNGTGPRFCPAANAPPSPCGGCGPACGPRIPDASAIPGIAGSSGSPGRSPFSQCTAILKDPMTTAAAIYRLVHHSVIVELKVPSYRLETAKGTKPPRIRHAGTDESEVTGKES